MFLDLLTLNSVVAEAAVQAAVSAVPGLYIGLGDAAARRQRNQERHRDSREADDMATGYTGCSFSHRVRWL